ncbi:GroES-like protein [Annulohypoxylon truncatum]|uniref:GroES-like protein n=1 Tax=Annulohypoxylon truncatum TaxID=327061 RepID=UPI0020084A23|nr:GroES-like protein [Annulohypoxylon truncatum]KAI1213563.1 GroES-like protein [Annulohypoxylon truncatum]
MRSINTPTISQEYDEILIHVKWTAPTPLDLHQADGGLLVEPPHRTGSTSAGIVVEVGPDVKHFSFGDRILDGFSLEQVVTLLENLVTAFNTISADLGLPTPWPKPEGYVPPRAKGKVLIWGASSSVGQLTIAVLKLYGYRHSKGAEEVFDYRSPSVVDDFLKTYQEGDASAFPLIVDCVGSQAGSVDALFKVAQSGATIAIMLPVIFMHATEEEAPEYSMDANTSAPWAGGVSLEIIPSLIADGYVTPDRFPTKALDSFWKGMSGKKLIWRASEE